MVDTHIFYDLIWRSWDIENMQIRQIMFFCNTLSLPLPNFYFYLKNPLQFISSPNAQVSYVIHIILWYNLHLFLYYQYYYKTQFSLKIHNYNYNKIIMSLFHLILEPNCIEPSNEYNISIYTYKVACPSGFRIPDSIDYTFS